MKRILLALLLVVLFGGCGARPTAPKVQAAVVPTPTHLRLLAIGDSLTMGAFASSASYSYVNLVASHLHAERLPDGSRYGVSAKVTDGQMQGHTLPTADVVIVELGTNGTTGPDDFGESYSDILFRVRQSSPYARLLCLGPWRDHTPLSDERGELIKQLCHAVGGTYLPLYALYLNMSLHGPQGRPTYLGTADWFHPNDLGHAAIARLILSALKE